MYSRILVSTDGTSHSDRAIKAAAGLAKACGASVTIYHAIPEYRPPYYGDSVVLDWPDESQYMKESKKAAGKMLDKAKATVAAAGVPATTMLGNADAPADAIIAAAKKAGADVIVMASHGRKGLEKLLLGSETQKVLTKSKLPVLVVR
jgi:nucleotide-binding universal stress UspA family protein